MSATAAMLTGMNVNVAGAAPVAGAVPVASGELVDPALGAATTFQLLIAELGAAQPQDVELAPLLLDASGLAIDADVDTVDDGEDATGDDAQSLFEAIGALCAWQVPVLPPQPPTKVVVGGATDDSVLADAGEGTAAVAATMVGAADADGSATLLAEQRVTAALRQAMPGNGADTSVATANNTVARPMDPGTAAVELPDLISAVVAESTPIARQKSATSAVESLLSQVDAATSGSLLRMPVVSSAVTRTVAVPVHDPRWAEAVATQVRWAVADGVQSATLKLVPEHLGPVELHIELKDNQVNVNFGAAQADTRQALQDALPRLRDVLAGAGITLGQANVQQQSGRASQSAAAGTRLQREDAVEGVVTHTRVALGLVDLYA